MGNAILNNIKIKSIIKNRSIPYVEYQVLEILSSQVRIQNIYSGKTELVEKSVLSVEYYYSNDSKHFKRQD